MAGGTSDFVDFLMDQLASIRGVSHGRFFGGVGLSSDGVQFAMIMENALYFVVDDSTREQYERMGSDCFSYRTKKRQVDVRKYYAVPAELIEDQEQLVALARASIRVASSKKKPATKRATRSRPKRARS